MSGVEPLTSVLPMKMKKREDVVTDGGFADEILANAPEREDHSSSCPRSSNKRPAPPFALI